MASGKGESVFFKGVAPGRFTMLHGRSYEMNSTNWSKTGLLNTKTMKLKGREVRIDLGEVRANVNRMFYHTV